MKSTEIFPLPNSQPIEAIFFIILHDKIEVPFIRCNNVTLAMCDQPSVNLIILIRGPEVKRSMLLPCFFNIMLFDQTIVTLTESWNLILSAVMCNTKTSCTKTKSSLLK